MMPSTIHAKPSAMTAMSTKTPAAVWMLRSTMMPASSTMRPKHEAEDAVTRAQARAEDRQCEAGDTSEDEVDASDAGDNGHGLSGPHEQRDAERNREDANEPKRCAYGVDAVLAQRVGVEFKDVDAHCGDGVIPGHRCSSCSRPRAHARVISANASAFVGTRRAGAR